MQSWSFVVFGYNEAATLEIVVQNLVTLITAEPGRQFEIIIVDDGSTDGTPQVVAKLKSDYPNTIRNIRHESNLGIGLALRAGYNASQMENVCAVPADAQFNVDELKPVLDFDSDRFIAFYRVENLQYTSFRNVLSYFNKQINKVFLGIRLKDVNWVKAYKQSDLHNLDLRITSSIVESEICAKLFLTGRKVQEEVSVYHPRIAGVSKGASMKIVFQAMRQTFRLILIVNRFKKRIRKS